MPMPVVKLCFVCVWMKIFGLSIKVRLCILSLLIFLPTNHTPRGKRIIFLLCPHPFSILCDLADFFSLTKCRQT